MIEGTYKATLKSASINYYLPLSIILRLEEEEAIAGLEFGRVKGKDDYYLYEGKYEHQNSKLKLEISVFQYRENSPNSLSLQTNFTVILVEEERGFNWFNLKGNVVKQPEKTMNVALSKVEPRREFLQLKHL